MADIKVKNDIIIKACLAYKYNVNNQHQIKDNSKVINYLFHMSKFANDTDYPYIIIDNYEFNILRKYL